MDYGEILKRAWNTIWKHKILWIFGLLASCTANSGGGGGGGGGGGSTNYNFSGNDFFNNNNFSHNFGNNFGNMDGFNHMFSGGGNEVLIILAIILGLMCLMVIFSIVAILLGSAGQIGLSRGAWWVDEGETDISFGRIWQSIGKPFWRVVLMHVAYAVISFIAALLAFGIIVILGIMTLGIGLICIIPIAILVGIVVGILVSILLQLMIPILANEDVSLLDSVKQAYQLIRDNFWPTVLMGIILGAIQLVVGLIIAIPMIIIIIAAVGFGAFATGFSNMGPSVLIVLIVAILCLLVPISIFINAVLQSFIGSAWTITYRRLTGKPFGGVSELPDGEPPIDIVAEESKPEAEKEEKPAEEEAPKKPRRRRKKVEPKEDVPEEE